MSRYAEGTKVTVETSRGEISGILAKHGVERMGWSTGPSGDQLVFELDGGTYRLNIAKPDLAEVRDAFVAAGGRWDRVLDRPGKVDQEWRRRWRANVLLLKAKLEFIDSGDTTLDRELLPYRVLKGGRTVLEELSAGGLPMLEAGAR